MSKGLLFWVLMIIALVFGVWVHYPYATVAPLGMTLLVWVLLGVLGWHCFGPAVK